MQKFRLNHQIKAPEIRLISDSGEQLGVMKLSAALALAQEHGLDLIEVSPLAAPPVAKLMDVAKFRYQQKKAEQLQKKKAKKVEVKTVRLSARIGRHDMATKAKQADGFLAEGDLIRVELRMRGREQAFADLGFRQIQEFQKLLTQNYRVEIPAKRMGPTITLTLAPAK